MTPLLIIGVDPGVTTGIMALRYPCPGGRSVAAVVQCDYGTTRIVLDAIMGRVTPDTQVLIALESFVVGPRSSRSSSADAGRITRNLIGAIEDTWGGILVQRRATDVKPWATDYRLAAIGALDATPPKMRDARDAGRHALYAAVHDCGIPDPLSRKAASNA